MYYFRNINVVTIFFIYMFFRCFSRSFIIVLQKSLYWEFIQAIKIITYHVNDLTVDMNFCTWKLQSVLSSWLRWTCIFSRKLVLLSNLSPATRNLLVSCSILSNFGGFSNRRLFIAVKNSYIHTLSIQALPIKIKELYNRQRSVLFQWQ